MSDPAAPWWADVQHLRPRQDGADGAPSAKRRFVRGRGADASIATLEHDVPEMPVDPWAQPKTPEESAARAAEVADQPWFKTARARAEAEDAAFLAKLSGEASPAQAAPAPEERDAPAGAMFVDAEPRRREPAAAEPDAATVRDLWDGGLEQTFATTPAWATEDDARLLPKGANRIENGRRTIEIRGQVDRIHGFTAPTDTTVATRSGRRRPARSGAERFERRPDRVAMWAFLLGLLLIIIAAVSDPGHAGATVLSPLGLL